LSTPIRAGNVELRFPHCHLTDTELCAVHFLLARAAEHYVPAIPAQITRALNAAGE
jgi:hypothetical protein